jgi:hypothetical protein
LLSKGSIGRAPVAEPKPKEEEEVDESENVDDIEDVDSDMGSFGDLDMDDDS